MTEAQFLGELVEMTGVLLLIDVAKRIVPRIRLLAVQPNEPRGT